MGNTTSNAIIPSANAHSRETILNEVVNLVPYHYSYARDLVNISFSPHAVLPFEPSVPSKHEPYEMVNMLVYCYDQINDLPSVIEAIISAKSSRDESIIEYLNTSFGEYIHLFDVRNVTYSLRKQFYLSKFHPYTFASKKMNEIPPTFNDLHNSFIQAYKLLQNEIVNETEIDRVTDYFSNVIPPSSLMAPIRDLSIRGEGTQQSILCGGNICPHGMCSNGTFLFAMIPGFLYAFPLTENGALLTPIIKSVATSLFLNNIAMSATNDTITILSGVQTATCKISDIVNESQYNPIQFNFDKNTGPNDVLVSDGVTFFRINDQYEIKDIQTNGYDLDSVILQKGIAKIHPAVNYLLPSQDGLTKHMTFTNGHFLGVLFGINNRGFMLNRVFSLHTGEHVVDDVFPCPENLLSCTYDALRRTMYGVFPGENNTLVVKRFYFIGSEDPGVLDLLDYKMGIEFKYRRIKKFAQAICHPFSTTIGSQMFPGMFIPHTNPNIILEFMSTLKNILMLPQETLTALHDPIVAISQSMAAIIGANIQLIKNHASKDFQEAVRGVMMDLMTRMPTNLAVTLFFGHIEFFMRGDKKSISIMVGLIQMIKWDPLFSYAIRCLENTQYLSLIPFNSNNAFTELIPQNVALLSNTPVAITRILLAHQHSIVSSVAKYMKKYPLSEVGFGAKDAPTTNYQQIINNFGSYLQVIITKFDTAISKIFTAEELQDSLIFILFDNFIRVIAPLIEFHSIARVTIAPISVLFTKIANFIASCGNDLNMYPKIQSMILALLFTYGKLASTLVQGGGLSEFESKCMWLVRANVNLVDDSDAMDKLSSDKVDGIKDPKMLSFLNGEDESIMAFIYKKHKAPFHKNLSPALKELDRIIMLAVCKHLGLTEQFFNCTQLPTLSQQLKKAADVMIKIRNHYRSMTQNGKNTQAEVVRIRGLMLLRMNSEFVSGDNKEALISEFLMSKFSPELITTIIRQQRIRIQTTLVGFALIDQTYSQQIHPLLNDILAYTLSCIESYEGLAMIMRITKLTMPQQDQMLKFFNRIIQMLSTTCNERFALIALRFFRDVDSVPEIHKKFFKDVTKILLDLPRFYPAFALCMSLVEKIDEIPESLLRPDASFLELSVAAELIKNIKEADGLFDLFTERFFSVKEPLSMRVFGRALISLFDKKLNEEKAQYFFEHAILLIGKAYMDYTELDSAHEIISVLRFVIQHNLTTNPILMKVILGVKDMEMICGALSVLSNHMEPMHAYCTARYHADRTTSTEVIVVPNVAKEGSMFIYKKPFTLDEEVKEVHVTPPAFIYAVPRVLITPSHFGEYEFILSFFERAFTEFPMIIRAIYVQVIAHFMKEPKFASLITEEHVKLLSLTPTSFCNITDTIKMIDGFLKKPDMPMVGCFNQLRFRNSEIISLLSPQIRPDRKFEIKMTTNQPRFVGKVGIVSDTTEGVCTRYMLACIPRGTELPTDRSMPAIPPSNTFTMLVDAPNKEFSIGENHYKFPMGGAFRVLISFSEWIPTTIDVDKDNFDLDACSPVQEHGALDFGYEGKIYEEPEWVKNITTIPEDPAELPPLELDTLCLSYNERACRNFVIPEEAVLIHPQFATTASKQICNELVRGLFCHLSCQWATIALTRLSILRPELLSDERTVVRLFSILCVQLEQFLPSEYNNGGYPFAMGDPIWSERAATNLLYLSLDNDSKNAMRVLSTLPHIATAICKAVKSMSMDPALHLCAYPNRSHDYYKPGKIPTRIHTSGPAIIAINSFTGFVDNFISCEGIDIANPGIFPFSVWFRLNLNPKAYALSVFKVSPMDNSWVFETPFEMLTLLKAFVAMSHDNEGRITAKTVLIDSLLISSPIIMQFLPQWIEQLQVSVPTTPLDSQTVYLKKLALLGSLIGNRAKNLREDLKERLKILYVHERRVLMSKMAAELAPHFPEFFNADMPPPTSDTCQIPDAIVDPGAITSGFKEHILMLRLFGRKYSTLVGFPFWEILPLWCRIAGYNKGEKDMIKPELRFTSANIMRLTNPSKLTITINITPKVRLPPDAIIMQSTTESFEDPIMLQGPMISDPIRTTEKVLWWSLIGVPQGWSAVFNINMTTRERIVTRSPNQTVTINVKEIREKFLEDMREFALEWDDDHTDALLNILPRSTLQMPEFSTINSIAVQSALSTQFSPTVLSLRALLIHHFNFIKMGHEKEISSAVWMSLSKFVSFEDASDDFIKAVKKSHPKDFVQITIDRHAAHRIIMQNEMDSPESSIVHQVAKEFEHFGPDRFRCLEKPWQVKFVGEEAIDAGGPARELMTEFAASIFEPTTRLCYNTPNGRHKTGLMRDMYVPFGPANRTNDFKAIGTYIGIVIRTGLMQDLPFAPFVWKALAGGELSTIDILSVDMSLAEQLSAMRQGEKEGTLTTFAWTIEQWDGTVVPLPGHSPESTVGQGEVEAFSSECINFRINSLKVALNAMREGFVENIGIDHHQLMTGARLSHMAQGSGLITVPQLKAITVVIDYSGLDDRYIQRFFRAVERFNADQRRLLLKFVTTLTRLPNSTINPNFVFKIDKLQKGNPDQVLPTASTCFNRLHLPMYSSDEICYQKLLTAIQYCQTMENR